MTAAIYNRLNATAERLIREYGKTITITTPGEPTGPAHDPVPGVPTTQTALMVETENSITNRNPTLVQQGDKSGIIEPELEVTFGDTLTIDGRDGWHFVALEPLNPGGLRLLYEFVVRQ